MLLVMLGAIIMAALIISLFFFKYWRMTNDRFFAFFSLAFLSDAITRLAMTPIFRNDDYEPFIYLVRLLSFMLIILAIADKNKRNKNY